MVIANTTPLLKGFDQLKKFRNTLFLAAILATSSAWGQELDPRAYQPAPIGLNAFTFSYTNSSGDILFEPSFPVKDVEANLHLEGAGYYRTFGFFGRFASASVAVPYAFGHLNGTLEETAVQTYRSGLGDIRTRFSVNLKGTPAMRLPEFAKHRSKTNIGVSMTVSAPTGQYSPRKVINIGQNRWAFKPEMAFVRMIDKWQMDVYGGAWFFTDNDNFTGKMLSQAPVGSLQFHLSYNLRPGMWFGVNANFYSGGLTTVDGVPGTLKQNNSRLGATVALPIARSQLIKFAVSRGVIATRGGNFTSFGVSYNYGWGAKK